MRPAWDQTICPCVGAERQGPHVHHHLADTGKGKQLQPILGDVPLVPQGEVLHHVRPGNSLLEQEERSLQQLQTQGEQAAGQDLRRCSLFFSPLCTEIGMSFVFVDLVFYA